MVSLNEKKLLAEARGLVSEGEYSRARGIYQQLCQECPQCAEAWAALSEINFMEGAFAQAESCSRRAVQLLPGVVELAYGLAKSLYAQGKMEDAAKTYQEIIALKSDSAMVHSNLAAVYQELGRFADARKSFESALRIQPGFADAWVGLGVVMLALDDPGEAESCCTRALEIAPDSQQVVALQVSILEKQGQYQKAYEVLVPLLQKKPVNPSIVLAFASIANYLDHRTQALDMLQNILKQNNSLPSSVQRRVLYRIGKIQDIECNYTLAFEAFRKANELVGARVDNEASTQYFESVRTAFSRQALNKMPRSGNSSERPVFVVGMPRSGTTLVEQILASHSRVIGVGELPDLPNAVGVHECATGVGKNYPDYVSALTNEHVNKIAEQYLQRIDTLANDAIRVIDKLPGNFQFLGMIALLFPKARIIHCRRAPIDTCVSIYFQDFLEGHHYSCNFTDLANYYGNYMRLMQHWVEVLDYPMLEVSYEDIVQNTEQECRKLLEFCELEWDPQCLRFFETERYVDTLSADQVRQPIYHRSVGRWKNYRDHIGELLRCLKHEGAIDATIE